MNVLAPRSEFFKGLGCLMPIRVPMPLDYSPLWHCLFWVFLIAMAIIAIGFLIAPDESDFVNRNKK